MIEQTGWLFDYYPVGSDLVYWFIPEGNEDRLRLIQPYRPSFFVGTPDRKELASFIESVEKSPSLVPLGTALRKDFWTDRDQELFEIQVANLDRADREIRHLYRQHPSLSYYDCDIPFEQQFSYRHGLFPTAYCRFRYEGERLVECLPLERPGDCDYRQVPLRVAHLNGEGVLDSRRANLHHLSLRMGDRIIEWSLGDLQDLFHSFNAYLEDWDPDLIWTTGGDRFLMPCLFFLARKMNIPLSLDREKGIQRKIGLEGRSYLSYGRVVYRDPDYPLWGRWHIDHRNCFLDHEAGLEGVIEAARVSHLPVQRMARRSIGTGISSVQMAYVSRRGYPIPWKKSQPEDWKTAVQLMVADRGGMTYMPRPGVYEEVVELDFVSMYPTIMARYNVSPETVNCDCCPDSTLRVPELGYRICEKRRGMISESLVTLLEKRIEYKRKMRSTRDPQEYRRYKNLQTALKWLLVCCFGYLGYKNARFGRIEAHESICAYSREMLLRARQRSEEWGFPVLHSLVDCVWLKRCGRGKEEIERLCQVIESETGLPIGIEGYYSWLVFLPSSQHEEVPVPARYFGRFEDGSMKYRGIEIRRGDQAPYVQVVQGNLLGMLSKAETPAAIREMETDLSDFVREADDRLIQRQVDLRDLLLKRKLSRTANEYKTHAMTATAARQAARIGKILIGGQDVHFVVVDSRAGNPDERIRIAELLSLETGFDVNYYRKQLYRAVKTLLTPFFGKERVISLFPGLSLST